MLGPKLRTEACCEPQLQRTLSKEATVRRQRWFLSFWLASGHCLAQAPDDAIAKAREARRLDEEQSLRSGYLRDIKERYLPKPLQRTDAGMPDIDDLRDVARLLAEWFPQHREEFLPLISDQPLRDFNRQFETVRPAGSNQVEYYHYRVAAYLRESAAGAETEILKTILATPVRLQRGSLTGRTVGQFSVSLGGTGSGVIHFIERNALITVSCTGKHYRSATNIGVGRYTMPDATVATMCEDLALKLNDWARDYRARSAHR